MRRLRASISGPVSFFLEPVSRRTIMGKQDPCPALDSPASNETFACSMADASSAVTLKDLTERVAAFASERNWEKFHSPRNLLLAMVGEVGELSEIFQWRGEVPQGLPGWNCEDKEHLGEELSDVLLYLVRLADICSVNLGQAALRKLEKNALKYPVGRNIESSLEKK